MMTKTSKKDKIGQKLQPVTFLSVIHHLKLDNLADDDISQHKYLDQ